MNRILILTLFSGSARLYNKVGGDSAKGLEISLIGLGFKPMSIIRKPTSV